MFFNRILRRYRNQAILALLLIPCVWPVYRYSVDAPSELIESPRFRFSDRFNRLSQIEARDSSGTPYFISIQRYGWERDVRHKFPQPGEARIGEGSIWIQRKHGGEIRFRRHNLSVRITTNSGNNCTLFDLASQIDERIQKGRGTRITLDTRGNHAFQLYIKPKLRPIRKWIRRLV